MARHEMQANEIIRYEGTVISRSHKGWHLEATLTSRRLILETKRGVFKKTYDMVGSVLLNTINVVAGEAQVSRKRSVVTIQASSADLVLEFPSRSEAKKFVAEIADAVLRAKRMQSSETQEESEGVAEPTAMQGQDAVQQKDSADSSYLKTTPTPQGVKKKSKKKWLLIVGVLLLVAISAVYRNFPALPEPVQEAVKKILPESITQKLHPWDSMVLKGLLPEPPTRVEDIICNREDLLNVELKNMSDVQFSEYVQELKKMGYVEFASEAARNYEAYNADGYRVKFYSYDGEAWDVDLTLAAPGERNTQWPGDGLAALLPPPVASNIKVNKNSEEALEASLYLMKKEAYKEFVDGCKKAGFTEASDEDDDRYCAYNVDGHYLKVEYSSYSYRADVSMKAPMKMTQLVWPARGPAKLLPTPLQKEGKITRDDAERFVVYVAGVSPDGYDYYVNQCERKGFTVDFSRSDISYHAYNRSGYELKVTYEYGNIMYISIDAPEPEATPTPKPTPTNTPKATNTPKLTDKPKNDSSANLVDGMRPEFKKAMDEYEEFFDDYVELMKKLEKNPDDLTLVLEYTQFMIQYDKTMKALEDWEDNNLNNKEMNYYITVTNRINKKLLEVAQ